MSAPKPTTVEKPFAVRKATWGRYPVEVVEIVKETRATASVRERSYGGSFNGRAILVRNPTFLARFATEVEADAIVTEAVAAFDAHRPAVEAAKGALKAAQLAQAQATFNVLSKAGSQ